MLQNKEINNKPFTGKKRRIVFTWNNYSETEVNYLINITEDKCDYICFGFEIGDEGTHHLQGYVEFKTPLAFTTVKSRLDPVKKSKSSIHIEAAREDDGHDIRGRNINYCKKEETKDIDSANKYNNGNKFFELCHVQKIQGKRNDWHRLNDFIKEKPNLQEIAEEFPEETIKYTNGIEKLMKIHKNAQIMESFKEQFIDAKLRDWQATLVNKLRLPTDDRTILWIYDTIGNQGKTWLSKYLVATMNAARFENASSKDIALAYEGEPIVVFDFSRTTEERLNYQIIESIKNGMVFSPKYNSCSKYFKSPHIVCFANWAPNMRAMSIDRWRITCLDNKINCARDLPSEDACSPHCAREIPSESACSQSRNTIPVVPPFIEGTALEDNIASEEDLKI